MLETALECDSYFPQEPMLTSGALRMTPPCSMRYFADMTKLP